MPSILKTNKSRLAAILVSLLIHLLLLANLHSLIDLFFDTPPQQDEWLVEMIDLPEPAQNQSPNEIRENRNEDNLQPDKADFLGLKNSRGSTPKLGTSMDKYLPFQQPALEQKHESSPFDRKLYSDLQPGDFDLGDLGEPSKEVPNQPPNPEKEFLDPTGEAFLPYENLGDFSLSTYEWPWFPYIQKLKKRVVSNLYPPSAFTVFGHISGEFLISFRIWPDGHLTNLEIRSSRGHQTLEECSVAAIQNSFPFLPLPAGFPDQFLDIGARFIYQGRDFSDMSKETHYLKKSAQERKKEDRE